MPKIQNIDPKKQRAKGQIKFKPIPVNQYQKTVSDVKGEFTKEEFVRIYHDMVVIREFETMLNLIKTTLEYNGISYNHPGPAHLSIGQEASAVGMAWNLDCDDYIFGSHRSHGEILAKGLSSIAKLSEKELLEVMENYFDGECYAIVKKDFKGTTKELAIKFLLYGTLAEIFARQTGFNKGLGGSMHAFFMPFGVYPNNAIVGGSVDVAVGAALYKKVNKKKGIVVANIGDASAACGPVWEGMNFSVMDQFKQLWDDAHKGGMPVIFNFMNNQYGMGGQTQGETMGYEFLARIGAGLNPDQLHAERVDGFNPLAVIDAFKRKKAILEKNNGPVLLDTLTYRFSGHSPSDASSYRSKEEMAAWEKNDSILTYGAQLVKAKVITKKKLEEIRNDIVADLETVLKLSIDDEVSPVIDFVNHPETLEGFMYSNQSVDTMEEGRTPDVNHPMEENPRVKGLKKKERFAYDAEGKAFPKIKLFAYRDAIFEAVIDRFYKDPTFIAYGEENRDWGGAFAVYRGLTEALPYHRLFNSPIAEASIVGTAVGYAMCGGRVMPELMYCDFLGRAGDEIFNQLAKWQSMSGGIIKMPVVLRVSVGSKYGAQHSQDWTSLVAHIPGLKVVFPATPYDAKGLMNSALQGTDPVIFFESQRLYDYGEQFHEGGVPEEYYEIEMGEPDVKLEGKDITILTVGATLYVAMEAAKQLKEKYGMEAEIIDARSVVPFNYEKVIASVKKTGRLVLASDASGRGSILKDIAQTVSEMAFDELDAPPVVVGSRNWITPPYEMEDAFFPLAGSILDAINDKIVPLAGHVSQGNLDTDEQIRRNKLGL